MFGILSRINTHTKSYNKVFCINTRLRKLCRDEGVKFNNVWEHFYERSYLFREIDSLNLRKAGSVRLARLLNYVKRRDSGCFWQDKPLRRRDTREGLWPKTQSTWRTTVTRSVGNRSHISILHYNTLRVMPKLDEFSAHIALENPNEIVITELIQLST